MGKRLRGLKRVIVRLLVIIVLLLYYPIVMSFVNAEHKQVTCIDVVAKVKNGESNTLITDEGLRRLILRKFPKVRETLLDSLHLRDKEAIVESLPVVERCEMYTTPGGVLHVDVWQREPIMRVFRSNGESYYMDSEGKEIKADYEMRTHVVIVNGSLPSSESELIALCQYINDNEFWKSSIEQIYISRNSEYTLVPRVGNHVIEFGGAERMEEKFRLLHKLYTEALDKNEWNLYKKVSVKYKGQIICTKR